MVNHALWPRCADSSVIWRLIGQTLILYVIVLIPVLWVGRRISRPLRSLAVAARDFAPGDGDTPLEERGPGAVRDVIAAFNALRQIGRASCRERGCQSVSISVVAGSFTNTRQTD